MATAVFPNSHKNYINGEWVEASGGKGIENRNPANTDDLVGIFPASTAEDVNRAVEAAKKAFDKWRLTPAPKRAEILYRAAEIMVQRKEDLAVDMTREMGKVLAETRGDVQEAIDMTYLMAGEGRRLFGQTTPSELPNKFAMSVRAPIGVCGLITPWNFPIAIPSWKMMPALVCGNTVVIKPAEDTPLSTYYLVQILEEAGLPEGVANIVSGMGPDAGAALVNHPDVKLISFTGSSEVGRIVSAGVREHVQALPSGDGRQKYYFGDGRREYRPCRRWRNLGRIRHHGPALHGREPRGRAQKSLQGVRRQVRGTREKIARRRRLASRISTWARRLTKRNCKR